MVDAALQGKFSTILAYGQTGSGKTFTVLGQVKSNPLCDDLLIRVRASPPRLHGHPSIPLKAPEPSHGLLPQCRRDILRSVKGLLAADDADATMKVTHRVGVPTTPKVYFWTEKATR